MNKKQKAELRRLAGVAYERELGMWLGRLQARFVEWERGEITSSELSEYVHEYHDGPSRDVYTRHVRLKPLETKIAWALAVGALSEDEVDPDVFESIRSRVASFRDIAEH